MTTETAMRDSGRRGCGAPEAAITWSCSPRSSHGKGQDEGLLREPFRLRQLMCGWPEYAGSRCEA